MGASGRGGIKRRAAKAPGEGGGGSFPTLVSAGKHCFATGSIIQILGELENERDRERQREKEGGRNNS